MTAHIPVPRALRHLINSNNQLLQQYQHELTQTVIQANEEMMRLLKLDPADGWKLDMETMSYVKTEPDATPVGE